MPNSPRFKQKVNLEERKKEVALKKEQYPNLIPIIVERHSRSTLKDLEKKKFLVSSDLKLMDLKQTIRKKLKLSNTESLFIFTGKTRLSTEDSLMKEIYERAKDEDGFLYLEFSNMETFG